MKTPCNHPSLTKVVDRLGMMTSTWTEQGQVVQAPVLESHYACDSCGETVFRNANPSAIAAYEDHITMLDKVDAVVDAFDQVRVAWSARGERR